MEFINLKKQKKLIEDGLKIRIDNVLNHGQFIMGPEVKELEDLLASYIKVKHCISCSSGTDALIMLLMANRIGPGDAVITSPFTYIATAEAVAIVGAIPIFVDINPHTFNIEPKNIETSIRIAKEKKLNPKAIIAVDLFGLPSRYRMISEIANNNKLFLIEDAAQAFGSQIRGQKAGSFGDASATSFFPAKPLGCYGDGGAIFTNNDFIASKLRSIRNHGAGSNRYDNVRLGLNGRLDTLQAAILLEKFSIFEKELLNREKIALLYSKNISSRIIKPYVPRNYKSSWAQYSILLPKNIKRERLIKLLKSKDIPSMIYYETPLHLQKVFKYLKNNEGDFPISESISKSILSLPMHPYLSSDEQESIIETLNNVDILN